MKRHAMPHFRLCLTKTDVVVWISLEVRNCKKAVFSGNFKEMNEEVKGMHAAMISWQGLQIEMARATRRTDVYVVDMERRFNIRIN